ncbi:hypothetical protein KC19_12G013800 [Ceratodon purpureus]|uniref:Uncharacterized protein n=1 Tax=Ceratodon purpureus TaxID=3225 RepID=A0A8T0G4U1_CERPU|nr:hypothetical protein KC19_12G013800 [Ceratodon purpureus]
MLPVLSRASDFSLLTWKREALMLLVETFLMHHVLESSVRYPSNATRPLRQEHNLVLVRLVWITYLQQQWRQVNEVLRYIIMSGWRSRHILTTINVQERLSRVRTLSQFALKGHCSSRPWPTNFPISSFALEVANHCLPTNPLENQHKVKL